MNFCVRTDTFAYVIVAMGEEKLLILDTDPGVDDCFAIMLALSTPQTKVLAITTVRGNCGAQQGGLNARRILKLFGKQDEIPIFVGCDKPLIPTDQLNSSSHYHGCDGMGDAPEVFPKLETDWTFPTESATEALVRLTREFPGNITLVALGPLTNVALAIRLDPKFPNRLKDFFCMGGNSRGVGNVTTTAEFNFHCDPEAAYICLKELECPITLTPWELWLDHPISCEEYLPPWDNPICRFARAIGHRGNEDVRSSDGYNSYCDEVAVAVALHPELVVDERLLSASVDLSGNSTRGQVVIESGGKENIRFVIRYDLDRMKQLMAKVFSLC